jgi:excisionase family DNA binding protein
MEQPEDAKPIMLKVPEAAKLARVGSAAIRRGIADGRIPYVRFGRNILLPRATFLQWLLACGEPERGAAGAGL